MSGPVGRPPTTLLKAIDLQGKLLKRYEPGHRFTRKDWNSIVVMACQVGINQADNLTRTGEAARLWVRHTEPWKPGFVELLHATPLTLQAEEAPAV